MRISSKSPEKLISKIFSSGIVWLQQAKANHVGSLENLNTELIYTPEWASFISVWVKLCRNVCVSQTEQKICARLTKVLWRLIFVFVFMACACHGWFVLVTQMKFHRRPKRSKENGFSQKLKKESQKESLCYQTMPSFLKLTRCCDKWNQHISQVSSSVKKILSYPAL